MFVLPRRPRFPKALVPKDINDADRDAGRGAFRSWILRRRAMLRPFKSIVGGFICFIVRAGRNHNDRHPFFGTNKPVDHADSRFQQLYLVKPVKFLPCLLPRDTP
jgi:hypothetical protein